jgi:hypothetical protein
MYSKIWKEKKKVRKVDFFMILLGFENERILTMFIFIL